MTRRSPPTHTLTELASEQLEVPAIELVVHGADGSEQRRRLGLGALVVGKDQGADIRVADEKVSRRHCSFSLGEQGIVLRDLGSKNGTFIGKARIVEAVLAPDVEVMVGRTRIVPRVVGQAATVPISASPRFGAVLGTSVIMRALFAQLEQMARTDETVLVLGESGSGKELIARGLHDASARKDGPFVVFDCGAVAPELIESELFGAVRGAFTGAVSDREGALAHARGGTLFLDEIGELPLDLQPKLLRALEARQFRPLGTSTWRALDARVLAATHRDLRAEVQAGTFRSDLYYRIAVLEARVPPLRDRRDDIPLLVDAILRTQTPPRAMSDLPEGALAMLMGHDWPGNVRELRNTVARLVLFPHLGRDAFDPMPASGRGTHLHLPLREARERVVEDFEQEYLSSKLKEHKGNVSRTAEAIGVSRQFLHRMLERYGIRAAR
jgi:two-component system, NtrC family, response regulator GlrR